MTDLEKRVDYAGLRKVKFLQLSERKLGHLPTPFSNGRKWSVLGTACTQFNRAHPILFSISHGQFKQLVQRRSPESPSSGTSS